MSKQEIQKRIEFHKNLGNGAGNIARRYEVDVRHYNYEVESAGTPEETKKALAGLTNAYNIIIANKVAEAVNLAEVERLEKKLEKG